MPRFSVLPEVFTAFLMSFMRDARIEKFRKININAVSVTLPDNSLHLLSGFVGGSMGMNPTPGHRGAVFPG